MFRVPLLFAYITNSRNVMIKSFKKFQIPLVMGNIFMEWFPSRVLVLNWFLEYSFHHLIISLQNIRGTFIEMPLIDIYDSCFSIYCRYICPYHIDVPLMFWTKFCHCEIVRVGLLCHFIYTYIYITDLLEIIFASTMKRASTRTQVGSRKGPWLQWTEPQGYHGFKF